ncbi:hypothetical protein IAD21_03700 [Abditibacteriota bacterium]|nr:hypothetical protein IAD21_03700 [Abditibacteriota bacterium]
MITIVGGIYYEYCMHPEWDHIYGSGGRAACAIAEMQESVELRGYVEAKYLSSIQNLAALSNFTLEATTIEYGVSFSYVHPLASPKIRQPSQRQEPLRVQAENVVRYGMLEGEGIVDAVYAVYDPQNVNHPLPFHANGSTAEHLAIVLNENEARRLIKEAPHAVEDLISAVALEHSAEVVVLKRGALGALVWAENVITSVPAYRTNHVWKIGSGDVFVAHFGYQWMCKGLSPMQAADVASRATAYYCQTRGFPSVKRLSAFQTRPIISSANFREGFKPRVYLAGPFFTLAQRWLIEEVRKSLLSAGLNVFSPIHDVGYGTAEEVVQRDIEGIQISDIMCAIGDGLDAGTIYEIGYARALNKPVVLYCENESSEDKKMMDGSDCIVTKDFTTAIYQTLWEAMSL